MPFGYGTRKAAPQKSRRPRRAPRRKPSVAVKTRPRRVQVATKRDLMRLQKQVRHNTSQAMGDMQKNTQLLRFTGVDADRWISLQTPHAIFHQGIQPSTPIYGLRRQAGGPGQLDFLTSISPATWENYNLADVAGLTIYDSATLAQYDNQRQYASSLDVQSKYVHYSSTYTFNFTSVSAKGYYQIDLIMPRNVSRPIRETALQSTTVYNVAQGLQGFIGLCDGCDASYTPNPNYFIRKRLARGYFNTVFNANSSELNTNPNFCVKLHVKNLPGKRLMISAQNDPANPATSYAIQPGEVPTGRQMWLVVSSSIQEGDQNANNHLKYHCVRTNRWRDYLGASH